ncbi:bromodomain-containing protein 4-like isoform X1 [Cyprinodon tularosa]|uniref:bromodomain-containing protein 4-like isoform X1 n=1 Tax=Cyprinodon tularosa TaxID=77115 RepID=UPI0018E1FFD4|nr:bromodomain-containing protein 4-like isoform X1 [Cyprinodon tularosa]
MHSAKATEAVSKTTEKKDAPRRVSAVRRKKEQEAIKKTDEKPRRQVLPRMQIQEPKVRRIRRLAPLLKAKIKAGARMSKKVSPCRPAPVYCPAPPGWYVHHIVTDNPYPPPTMSAPSAPIVTVHPAASPSQPPYQQQPPPPTMQPFYAHYQPYQPPVQPMTPPPSEPSPPEQQEEPEAPQPEALVEPETPTPSAEAQTAAAEVHGEQEGAQLMSLLNPKRITILH